MIVVRCPRHGEWRQRAGSHIRDGFGCRKCTNLAKYGAEHPMSNNAVCLSARSKRQATFDVRFGGHPMKDPVVSGKASRTWAAKSPDEITEIMKKKAETYGYTNPFSQPGIKDAIKQTRIRKGQWVPDEKLSDWMLYRRLVWKLTERSFRANKLALDPEAKRGPNYHLDHKYSIRDGFLNGVRPEALSHSANLQIKDRRSNQSKGGSSEITLAELLSFSE